MECTREGVWLVDKPIGISSFAVVSRMRRILKIKKIGHAGTLDPLASGLMVLCSGSHTKIIDSFLGMDKEYTGMIYLGAETESYDLEHPPVLSGNGVVPEINEIEAVLNQFRGEIFQTPPVHSAIKIDGKRAYKGARTGNNPEMKARQVKIHLFEIKKYRYPELWFKVRCSKGTYIRSLAHDLGKALGTGAYLAALTRTGSGPFRLKDASKFRDLNFTISVEHGQKPASE